MYGRKKKKKAGAGGKGGGRMANYTKLDVALGKKKIYAAPGMENLSRGKREAPFD